MQVIAQDLGVAQTRCRCPSSTRMGGLLRRIRPPSPVADQRVGFRVSRKQKSTSRLCEADGSVEIYPMRNSAS